jgi:hypothetical protein
MIKKVILLVSMAGAALNAQVITQNFGSGANAFSIDFVQIGNPGNIADTSGSPNPAGAVNYIYRIGKYEVSREMIDKANTAGGLNIQMYVFTEQYRNGNKKPAAGISWYEAARFVNWLNTSTGNTAAYKFDQSGNFQIWSASDAGYDEMNPFRNSLARYYLPNNDEWYKAAYGSPAGSWFDYPTGSNTAPESVASGTNANTAIYGQTIIADVDNAGGLSPYGTMAQGGNLREWIETAWDKVNDTAGENRTIRGGPWYNPVNNLDSSNRFATTPDEEDARDGFRVAMLPKTFFLQLNYDSTKGEVITDPLLNQFIEGASVTVTANPKEGYGFSSWSGASSGPSKSLSLVMNSDIALTATFTEDNSDTDGDGLTNYQEVVIYGTNPLAKDSNSDGIEDGQAVSLGYRPTLNFSALIVYLQSHPPQGLFTADQIQNMAMGDLVLNKNVNGTFTLNYDIEQSTDLRNWTPYQTLALPLNGLPTDKAFVRVKLKK